MLFFWYFLTSSLVLISARITLLSGKELFKEYNFLNESNIICCQTGKCLDTYIFAWFTVTGAAGAGAALLPGAFIFIM